MVNATAEFTQRLSDVPFPHDYTMVSFDIVSLFTNVPLTEVIDLCCDYVYSNMSTTTPGFEKKHFRKLLYFATSGEFLYKDRLFKQIDGVSMGSPLGPTFANLFLAHLEKNWQNTPNSPVSYCRYVDDICCVFDNSVQDHVSFLRFLNEQHPNLRFTSEIGPRSLSFLDVNIDVQNGKPIFSIFRKETYTGLLLNFHAFCPFTWKRSLILCFLQRAFRLCSNWTCFHKEVEKLKDIFSSNGYPVALFSRTVRSFVSSTLSNHAKSEKTESAYTLVLPYFGTMSDKFRFRFRRLCRRYDLNIDLVFKPFKTSQYFSLKSACPDSIKSCLVYSYICSRDSKQQYIGKTKRHFTTRIREHANSQSAINTHCSTCTDCFNPKNFTVLRTCNSDYEATICEALLIKQHSPTLNSTISNNGQSTFLTLS